NSGREPSLGGILHAFSALRQSLCAGELSAGTHKRSGPYGPTPKSQYTQTQGTRTSTGKCASTRRREYAHVRTSTVTHSPDAARNAWQRGEYIQHELAVA
ncbi:hypothetical protein SARC_11897, partial [Sphaeroforma arctica JP610]